MQKRVLITGGAGFIGSHLADELLRHGYSVRAFDNLAPQVHGERRARPAYLASDVELVVGDVRSPDDVRRALRDIDAVFHLAAAVGVGQSMYEIASYTSVNNLGTAVLLEALAQRPVAKLIVASSMSIYGEGLYRNGDRAVAPTRERSALQLRAGDWELRDEDGTILRPVPTPETKTPSCASVYALSKFDQERLCLMIGQAYAMPVVALRFFNVYGPRQALSNPYTGVLAIFAARLLNDQAPLLFEDGLQRRDFVNARDVARACRLALERGEADGRVLNVGSGEARSVREVGEALATAVGRPGVAPVVTGAYRKGDVRHCYADIGTARRVLGYRAEVPFAEGLAELAAWLADQHAVDRVVEHQAELKARGLVI
ncbi:MAG TPA: NAD-dependent epimerase/dehydratase family protein [Polyangia bacterium]